MFEQKNAELVTEVDRYIRTSFGQSQKIVIEKALTLEHYIRNKVFVSHFVTCRVSPLAAHPRVGLVRIAWRVRRALLFYRPKAERALVF